MARLNRIDLPFVNVSLLFLASPRGGRSGLLAASEPVLRGTSRQFISRSLSRAGRLSLTLPPPEALRPRSRSRSRSRPPLFRGSGSSGRGIHFCFLSASDRKTMRFVSSNNHYFQTKLHSNWHLMHIGTQILTVQPRTSEVVKGGKCKLNLYWQLRCKIQIPRDF